MSVASTIAARVARRIGRGEIVNLGIGIPTLVGDELPDGQDVVLQTENGMVGVGPTPSEHLVDPNLVNAGKLPVGELPGASYFSSSTSFAMIRGGHIDVAVLGVLQVDERGRIANWALPGRPVLGVGGAMDLLVGARRVIVATTHLNRDGEPKLVRRCAYPLSGDRPADLVVTERSSFEVDAGGLRLVELAARTSLDWVRENTEARFEVGSELGEGR